MSTETVTAAAIDVEDSLDNEDDQGYSPANEGSDEVVIPAPGPVSIYTQIQDEDVIEYLCVGWNSAGSPIVVGNDGGLRLLGDDEYIRDVTW